MRKITLKTAQKHYARINKMTLRDTEPSITDEYSYYVGKGVLMSVSARTTTHVYEDLKLVKTYSVYSISYVEANTGRWYSYSNFVGTQQDLDRTLASFRYNN